MILAQELRLWENSSAQAARVLIVALRGGTADAAPTQAS